MKNTRTWKPSALAAACAAALGVLSASASAQVADEKALLTDSRGAPIMSGAGLCWHSGFGPPPQWTRGCHAEQPITFAPYVAPAAAPLPVYERVSFDSNVLFDSDKSALRLAGREKLDDFVGRMHGLDTQSIMVVGYADRMGTGADNQILSEERVGAVKTYLVGKGIASKRVQTRAWGETQPNTLPGECGEANTAKNVACMQPDRHVFIEVSGTRIAN